MSGLLSSLAVFVAVAGVVFGTAALLVLGALGIAAFLPRGTPLADGLREFAGEVSHFAWRAVRFLDGLVFLAAIALGAILTLVLS